MSGVAPLVGIPVAPVPDGASAEWFRGAGGVRLRAALFSPPGGARGSVVVNPGRTEYIEKYFEVAQRLTSRGFVVLIHDWRGQGLSDRLLADRRLGHALGHDDFLADQNAMLSAFEARLPRPWFAIGHSMGGCLALLALALRETRFSGALLSAPMLGIRTGTVPVLAARFVARGMSAMGQRAVGVPGLSAPEPVPFEANILTHDRARYERNEGQVAACPDLGLGAPTWGWLGFAFAATSRLARGPELPTVSIPVTVLAAGEELIVDNRAMRAVTARLPHGRFLEVAGAYHEIPQETDEVQAVFWNAFDDLVAA